MTNVSCKDIIKSEGGDDLNTEKDIYKTSRVLYVAEAALEYFISILISGAYFAKLTTSLGISDGLTAILSSVVALGSGFQIFAIALFQGGPVKKRITRLHLLNQLMFMGLYLVPLAGFANGAKRALFIALLIGGYFLSNAISSPKINWFMSLVDDRKRGIFTSIKEMFSLIGGMAFSLIMGDVIDRFEAAGNTRGAFAICAIVIFVFMTLHTLTLIFSKEKPLETIPAKVSVLQRFKGIVGDKDIMKVVLVSVFGTISTHIAVSFFSTYQVKELGFSMSFVALLSVLYAVVRIPFSFIFGRIADKTSFANMLRICYSLSAVSFLVAAFCVPANGKVFFSIYYALNAAAMGGINSSEINLIYDYVEPEKRSDALAVKQTFYGISGFLSTLLCTPLLNYIQANGNRFLGMNVYAQQVLSVIACICTLLLIVYLQKVVLKIVPRGNKKNRV